MNTYQRRKFDGRKERKNRNLPQKLFTHETAAQVIYRFSCPPTVEHRQVGTPACASRGSQVQSLDRRTSVLVEVCRGFPQNVEANSVVVTGEMNHNCFLPHFPNVSLTFIFPFDAIGLKIIVKRIKKQVSYDVALNQH
jgi:hypothetical protein